MITAARAQPTRFSQGETVACAGTMSNSLFIVLFGNPLYASLIYLFVARALFSLTSLGSRQSVEDFIRNFLYKATMTRTLATFQLEWYEMVQKGELVDAVRQAAPDVYIQQGKVRVHPRWSSILHPKCLLTWTFVRKSHV